MEEEEEEEEDSHMLTQPQARHNYKHGQANKLTATTVNTTQVTTRVTHSLSDIAISPSMHHCLDFEKAFNARLTIHNTYALNNELCAYTHL